jgi:L-2-amino-thiazoline-4-carboxylic acid hydrolase-like protein
MGVLDDFLVDPKISMMDKVHVQAQVLVPVMRVLRAELGKEKADTIVRDALRDWSRELFAAIGKSMEGSPKRKWIEMQGAYNDVTQRETEFEILRRDKDALHIDVTSCRFAAFFGALGEPELGALLVCHPDADIVEAAGGEVKFDRAQTLMLGGSCCTFRYKFEPR